MMLSMGDGVTEGEEQPRHYIDVEGLSRRVESPMEYEEAVLFTQRLADYIRAGYFVDSGCVWSVFAERDGVPLTEIDSGIRDHSHRLLEELIGAPCENGCDFARFRMGTAGEPDKSSLLDQVDLMPLAIGKRRMEGQPDTWYVFGLGYFYDMREGKFKMQWVELLLSHPNELTNKPWSGWYTTGLVPESERARMNSPLGCTIRGDLAPVSNRRTH